MPRLIFTLVALAGGLFFITLVPTAQAERLDDPIELGSIETDSAFGVSVVGGLAYVADGSSGLRVIDVSNPAAPVEVGSIDTPDFAYGVSVVGGLAYVADGSSVRVIDVSNPAVPVELGSIETEFAYGVSVVGGLAYVVDSFFGLRVVAVSHPALPVDLGAIDGNGVMQPAVIDGDPSWTQMVWMQLELQGWSEAAAVSGTFTLGADMTLTAWGGILDATGVVEVTVDGAIVEVTFGLIIESGLTDPGQEFFVTVDAALQQVTISNLVIDLPPVVRIAIGQITFDAQEGAAVFRDIDITSATLTWLDLHIDNIEVYPNYLLVRVPVTGEGLVLGDPEMPTNSIILPPNADRAATYSGNMFSFARATPWWSENFDPVSFAAGFARDPEATFTAH